MKKQYSFLIITLLASAAVTGIVYAQDSAPATAPATASGDTSKAKETQKEKMLHESAQLPPEKAKLYNDAMQQAIDINKDVRAQLRKAHEEADAILTAEKFDKAAFLAKTAELDQLYAKQRTKMNDAFVSVVENFTQEDRKILLKARNDNRHHLQQ